jgi:hypothetical protein
MRILAMVLILVATGSLAQGQARTVFSGIPSVKVNEGGNERLAEAIVRDRAVNLGTAISEIGGKYYWATRGNKELVRHTSGGFVTYIAIDGSGYVRVIDPAAKATASLMSSTEAKFDYVEHLLLGLRSVSYYGNAQ